MHPCPCCGHATLPDRGAYDVCPVCWWEDEGLEPWEVSGPNGQTLVEAQREFLAERRPYRRRPGRVRPPRRGEERAPDWRPFELTDELRRRVGRATADRQSECAGEEHRAAEDIAGDPEASLHEYAAAVQALKAEAARLSHTEVRSRLRNLGGAQGLALSEAQLELLSRLIEDEHYYRRHPLRAAAWLLRYSRPATLTRRWEELRTGSIRFAG